MSSSNTGIVSTPTIYGNVDYGPTFGNVRRPLNTKRIVTVAGAVAIIPYDVIVIVNQTIPAIFNLQLPDLSLWMTQPYGGFDLTIKNRNAGFDGTILPFGSQKIDGLSSLVLAGGPAGVVILSPLNDFSGWETI
jgi:hypothetical protein